MKPAASVWSVLFVIFYLFTGCEKKQQEFDDKELKTALGTCLDDHMLRWRMDLNNYPVFKQWFLNGNVKIKDSLILGDRRFKLQDENCYLHNDSNVLYHVSYSDKNFFHISFRYKPYPRSGSETIGEFDFVYEHERWKMTNHTAGIRCGKATL